MQGEPREFVLAGVADAAHRVDVPSVFFSTGDTAGTPDAGRRDRRLPSPGYFGEATWPEATGSARPASRRLTGDERGAAEFAGIATSLPLIILSGVFGGMVAVVMALVVSATIGLSVRQRRRELALLRASGATPGQVRKMVVAETMLVAVVALAAGLLLGRTMGTLDLRDAHRTTGSCRRRCGSTRASLPFAGAALTHAGDPPPDGRLRRRTGGADQADPGADRGRGTAGHHQPDPADHRRGLRRRRRSGSGSRRSS